MTFKSIRKWKHWKLMLMAAAAIGVVGFAYLAHQLAWVETDDAVIEGRVCIIASKIPGTVQTVNVEDNQFVKKGELLVQVDPADYQLKVQEAQANLDIKKAGFEQAARDKERAESLYKDEVYSKERHENIMTAYSLAKAQLEAAQAQFEIATRNLGYARLCAPSDGFVTKKSVEVGNQIQPMQALMAVVSEEKWVIANFKETQITRMCPGQEARITIDTYHGKTFKGHVDSIQRGTGGRFSMFPPENAAGNFVKVVQRVPVKIVFSEKPGDKYTLAVGMSVVPKVRVG